MELPLELKNLIEDIIDLMPMDEARKNDMKQDPDAYIVSLLLHFKSAMSDPRSNSLHSFYASDAISYRSLLRAQEIIGKDNIASVRFLEPFSKPYDERQTLVMKNSTKYCRDRKKKKRA